MSLTSRKVLSILSQSPEWTHRPGNTHSTVVIEVKLPYSAAVRSLETVLPLFLHEVADFRDSVIFGTLSLKSTNMPIMAKVRLHCAHFSVF